MEALRKFGLGDDDLAAWEEGGLPDDAFDDWLTDRVARRPAGRRAREVYGADDVHDFARRAILDALALDAEDRLLDVGCGGGQDNPTIAHLTTESGGTTAAIGKRIDRALYPYSLTQLNDICSLSRKSYGLSIFKHAYYSNRKMIDGNRTIQLTPLSSIADAETVFEYIAKTRC
jgi:hypothetical protein